jgi:23S rRNA U2552 (ribose-2'-O)-methylase RlmE/FtsJ
MGSTHPRLLVSGRAGLDKAAKVLKDAGNALIKVFQGAGLQALI